MILVGIDKELDRFKEYTFLKSFNEIDNTKPNSLIIVEFKREDLKNYKLDIPMGVQIESLKEFILLINTKVQYAICNKSIVKDIQKCADDYLTDIKVLVEIFSEDEIEWVAKNEIDGAIINQISTPNKNDGGQGGI